jgi:electron transfer flavoprotein beta subunit
MISLKHLEDQDPEHYGLSGSPTQVEEIFPPNKKMESKILEGSSKDLSKAMFDILKESKYV